MLATVPTLLGMIEVYPGYPVANSVMLPIPVEWWLRPVRSAARVGEHRAVVLKLLYLSPRRATRSRFGVGIGPPNVLAAPKPVSSVMMSKTFGAPLGAVTAFGKSGVDSLAVRPCTPPNGGSGTGRTGEPPACWFSAAPSPASMVPVTSTIVVSKVIRDRIGVPPCGGDAYRTRVHVREKSAATEPSSPVRFAASGTSSPALPSPLAPSAVVP